MGNELLGLRASAPYFGLGITENTLRGWIKKGYGPKPIRVGSRYYFTPLIIETWKKRESERALASVTSSAVRKRPRIPKPLLLPQSRNLLFQKVHYRGGRSLSVVTGEKSLQGCGQNESVELGVRAPEKDQDGNQLHHR